MSFKFLEGASLQLLASCIEAGESEQAKGHLRRFEQEVRDCAAENVIVSCPDLCGFLPGTTRKKRVYPNVSKCATLIQRRLVVFNPVFYFFERSPSAWIRSAFSASCFRGGKFATLEAFDDHLRRFDSWEPVIEQLKNSLADRLVVVNYEEDQKYDAVTAFVAVLPIDLMLETAPRKLCLNKSVEPKRAGMFACVNNGQGSKHAKAAATQHLISGMSRAVPDGLLHSVPRWPPQLAAISDIPADLNALWSRARQRVPKQSQPDLLPSSPDYEKLKGSMIPIDVPFPSGSRVDMRCQAEILRFRLRGLPEIIHLLGLAISYLRRDTEHTLHARTIFHSIWHLEREFLLAVCPTRWLISSLQTFMDHGSSGEQRQIGAAGYFFANLLKSYEAERALEGHAPDATYSEIKPSTVQGFLGMDRFALGGTDLMRNTLSLLVEISCRDGIAGSVLREFLLRTRESSTLFSRMDYSRLRHRIEIDGFQDCWSFGEPPNLLT